MLGAGASAIVGDASVLGVGAGAVSGSGVGDSVGCELVPVSPVVASLSDESLPAEENGSVASGSWVVEPGVAVAGGALAALSQPRSDSLPYRGFLVLLVTRTFHHLRRNVTIDSQRSASSKGLEAKWPNLLFRACGWHDPSCSLLGPSDRQDK